jgi:zinc transport system substrate-binding protein
LNGIFCSWKEFAMRAEKIKRKIFRQVFSVLVFLSFSSQLYAASAVKIAVTILPLADIAKQIAGEESEIITLLPPGANPHAFELTIQTVKELSDVQIAFAIGHGLDDWVQKALQAGSHARVVIVDANIELVGSHHPNPHYWLSAKNAKIMAQNMERTLSALNPEEAFAYQERLKRFWVQLDEVDQRVRQLFSDLPHREIVTFHESWPYFASDYDLVILGSVESCQDQGPTPRKLAHLSDLAHNRGIKVLFSEPTASKSMAQSVAQDLNLTLYQLDPMGRPEQSFSDLILENAHTISEALRHG